MAKENNGRAARRKLTRRLTVAILCTAACGTLAAVAWLRPLSSSSSSAAVQGLRDAAARKLRRRRQPPHISGISQADLDQILQGHVNLVELHIDSGALTESTKGDDGNYNGIVGDFCKLNWDLHKHDPSTYPMFRDLVGHSPDCERNRISVNLKDIYDQARYYDSTVNAANVLIFGGAVFHESRCGSTLTANVLAAMQPEQHRVYSESTPALQALKQACGEDYDRCSLDTAATIFHDTVYLMRRSDRTEETHAFFKIQSAGSRNVQVFQKAFPTTPYLFVYRDPVQVMMSHLKGGGNKRNANCVRPQRNPPRMVKEIVAKYGGTGGGDTDNNNNNSNHHPNAKRLSPEDYCAAHLASLTEPMVEHMTDLGHPVNYEDLPDALYHDLLPHKFHLTIGPDELTNMQTVAAVYSKGRGAKAATFTEDSEQKEAAATTQVRDAADTYLSASYAALERLAEQRNTA